MATFFWVLLPLTFSGMILSSSIFMREGSQNRSGLWWLKLPNYLKGNSKEIPWAGAGAGADFFCGVHWSFHRRRQGRREEGCDFCTE
ncbi:uncharacterized protein [Henckelia pumila]|uniref:uncharacterized protein isoform X5 n=1 Tax=Henckelia pumila TaxID=405737 RepID=UPI003C6E246F